ncbi:MAG: SLC13/DASS family transporter [Sphingomonadales bacterium]|nr:MAG: SLC13/DASS family transporter [Sphingomonadales bacterium]TNF05010.1 MAG: SLC13/DASS family transporter [Sphingomonadales bacterium]
MSDALLSALILGGSLILFVSERVRHDLVALFALLACLAVGLVRPADAFSGFADPAVLAVAAILVVGRAIELSGVASAIARVAIPAHAGFGTRLTALLAVAMLLSAFMNNIAALVITMPVAIEIAREARRPVGATLMPLAFASILGGMTTLIGTPANLILSSVRQSELGTPFGFFTMTPVGVAVALLGLLYLSTVGWRLLPVREQPQREERPPWRVFELAIAQDDARLSKLKAALRATRARMLAAFRFGEPLAVGGDFRFRAGDRLLIASRIDSGTVADKTGLVDTEREEDAPDSVTAHVAVGHGSYLSGNGYNAMRTRSDNRLRVVAVGPRAAREKIPLARLRIRPGDQLFVRGTQKALAELLAGARLLEIDRFDPVPVRKSRSVFILAVFALAIVAIVTAGLSPAIAFVAAAVVLAATRLIPTEDIYRSIDWSVIVLLGAMIPVGQSFEDSGAATIAAQWLSHALAGQPLFLALAAICGATLMLSIFLNNVATAVIMGPLAIDAAHMLNIAPDAALLAVLIGASSDFLTPIGHQNNLLVMGPGGYRFTDYARMGGVLVVIVVLTSAFVLSALY